MIIEMSSLHKILHDKKIALFYSGPLWSERISSIADSLTNHAEIDKEHMLAMQEVFSVFIEQANNMLMYSEEKERYLTPDNNQVEISKGTLILGKEGNAFFIQTGNLMKSEFVTMVKNKIDYLNTLDKTELRKYYKEQLRFGDDNPDSKGAGLGFIEIARRISSKIEYSFTPFNNELTYFTFFVLINGKEAK